MTQQNNENSTYRSSAYFKYMIFVLILVQILDTYTGFYNSVIPSKIVEEFLSDYPQNVANSIFAFFVAIASLGSYVAFLVWYSSDRIGRKFLLVLTIFGLALSSLGILFSRNIIEYTIYRFLLTIFAASDIWLIYINEESPPEKKAMWTNIVLMGGIIGAVLMPVFRAIYITESSPVGAWRGMTYFSIALGIPLGILVALTIKETSKFQEVKENRPSTKERTNVMKKNLKTIFRSDRRIAYIIILITVFIWALNYIFLTLGELFIAQSPNLREGDINIVVTIMSLAVVVGFAVTAVLADKIGRKPLLFIYCSLFFIGSLLVINGVRTPGIALILVCLGTSLMNIAFWGLWVLISIITIELIPTDSRGTGTGLKGIISAIGSTLGLILAGIITYFYSLDVAFLLFAILLLIPMPLIYKFVIETKGIDLGEIK
ncbi:MAG: MFS transporter [Candidatus Hodarchaeota archaeon]